MAEADKRWNRQQTNREGRLARAREALGPALTGKVVAAGQIVELLHAVLESGDRVCLEGNNQKQADFLGKALTRPINELTAIAVQLSNGELQVNIPQTARGDEIGSLARAIERLGVSIQLAMDRLRKKV